ncbi:hypothetical protein LCGC14_2589280 [marine sediment metagenome]|uniref:DNA binding HTH domain-containing protein n=1 Tax=marine sediment metagenome TaxID=412755 RepID=A0A0F9ACE4_9ZZZZ
MIAVSFAATSSGSVAGPLERIERRYILQSVDGNRMFAARILGLNRKTLYRKLRHHGTANCALS